MQIHQRKAHVMSENTTVELWLLDSVYKLGCKVDQQTHLKHAGELLEQKFQAMRGSNPRMDNQKIAIMVALQLMQDVLDLNKTIQSYHQCELLLTDLVDDVEKKIGQIKV